MTKIYDFENAKERNDISKITEGGIFLYNRLLDHCELFSAYNTPMSLLACHEQFESLCTIRSIFQRYVSSFNQGVAYLKENGSTEELRNIEELNARADIVYVRLDRLYHDTIEAQSSTSTIVLLKHR